MSQLTVVDQLVKVRRTAERAADHHAASLADSAAWLSQPQALDRSGRFFAAITIFMVAGHVPG